MTILTGCAALIEAIDVYLAKADSDLTGALNSAGFVEPKETVQAANELESKIADALVEETGYIKSKLREAVDLYMFASAIWAEAREYDDVDKKLEEVFYIEFSTHIPKLTSEYIKLIDPELTVAAITRRTTDWARSWSVELGRLMKLNTHEELERLLVRGLENGQNVAEFTRALMDSKIRDEYYKARRVAITETLRAHSVAQQEAITQNPAVEYKEWVHTGSYRNDPRPGHVALGGTVIPKDQRFTLKGADGETYDPMYPRDTNLPAGESINCHCIHRGIASEDALGLSLEERRRLQQEAIDADDSEWEKELNARNKARAGIANDMPDSKRGTPTELGRLSKFTKEDQIKYMGGKRKWALYKSGVITNDDTLLHVRHTTLKSLNEEGIITINAKMLNHSNTGEFTPKSGRMISGGHGQANIDELNRRGTGFIIEKTYPNGVRVGGVDNHKDKSKKLKTAGQSWFPESWSRDDILVAGTYVANAHKPSIGICAFDNYRGVRVAIIIDDKGGGTIFPDKDRQL